MARDKGEYHEALVKLLWKMSVYKFVSFIDLVNI